MLHLQRLRSALCLVRRDPVPSRVRPLPIPCPHHTCSLPQVIKCFPEMEHELDALSNEREKRDPNEPQLRRTTKFSRVYANPSQDKVIAATMIQVPYLPRLPRRPRSPGPRPPPITHMFRSATLSTL
jgi:hypothetical protein